MTDHIIRRVGTAPADRADCTSSGNCPDVFETDSGFAIIGEVVPDPDHPGMTKVIVPREVLLAAARQLVAEGAA